MNTDNKAPQTEERKECPRFYTMDVRRRYLVEVQVAARSKAYAIDTAVEESIIEEDEGSDIGRYVEIRYKQEWDEGQRCFCDFDEDSWYGEYGTEIITGQVYPLLSSDFSFEDDDKLGMKHYRITFLIEDCYLFHGKAYSDESAIGMAAKIQFRNINICKRWVFLKNIERIWEDDNGANDDEYILDEYDEADNAYEYDPLHEGYYDERWRIHKDQTWGHTPKYIQEEDSYDKLVRWRKMKMRNA